MKTLAELRDALAARANEMQTALDAWINPAEGADVDALERAFTDAETAHAAANTAYTRALATHEARSNMPALPSVQVTNEESVYRRGGKESFFVDVARACQGDAQARERLIANNREVSEKRAQAADVEGTGQEFLHPTYLADVIPEYRPKRKYVDSVPSAGLPAGLSSVVQPKIIQGASAAPQGANLTPIVRGQVNLALVRTNVVTIAGELLVAQQLLDQAVLGINVDEQLNASLVRAYDQAFDVQALVGTGVENDQHLGVLNVPGKHVITYTTGTPSAVGVYTKIAQAISLIDGAVGEQPTKIAMHPRRWWGLVGQVGPDNKPLVVPASVEGNSLIKSDSSANGIAGYILGIPVITDANLPTNRGAGTNEDVIVVYVAEDQLAHESVLRFRSFEQTHASQLAHLMQVYGYTAGFFGSRRPEAVAVITGTGLVTPSFA